MIRSDYNKKNQTHTPYNKRRKRRKQKKIRWRAFSSNEKRGENVTCVYVWVRIKDRDRYWNFTTITSTKKQTNDAIYKENGAYNFGKQ